MTDQRYGFPLCIQLTPPDDIFESADFEATLRTLQQEKFYGVELNLTDFVNTDAERLKAYLGQYGLRMTAIASGVYAKKNGLSLSSQVETERRNTVKAFASIMDFAEKMDVDVICGFIKGPAASDAAAASAQMQKSVDELKETFRTAKSRIYLEATNHYEAAVVNQVSEGVQFLGGDRGNMCVLPDTYHMNIEESSMSQTIVQYREYFDNIHISDNNRYFPGFGAIDFFQILSLLKGIGYQGTITIEGRNRNSLNEDIRKSCSYLAATAERLL